jgi:hypothetical protein
VTLLALSSNPGTVFIGGAGVTTADGFPLAPGASQTLQLSASLLYVIAAADGSTVSWIQQVGPTYS